MEACPSSTFTPEPGFNRFVLWTAGPVWVASKPLTVCQTPPKEAAPNAALGAGDHLGLGLGPFVWGLGLGPFVWGRCLGPRSGFP